MVYIIDFSAVGPKHREAVSVTVRSISYGPASPKKSAIQSSPAVSKHAKADSHWVKWAVAHPLLDAMTCYDQVAQVHLNVEGVNVSILSTLPNLEDDPVADGHASTQRCHSQCPDAEMKTPCDQVRQYDNSESTQFAHLGDHDAR